MTIGRSIPGYHNQIDIRPRVISRMHLYITRNMVALDMRSLNGTTVNAEFLPYGMSRKLKGGDVIVIAGIAPFRLLETRYTIFPFIKTNQIKPQLPSEPYWGILIDGSTRIEFLGKSKYFFSKNEKGKIVSNEKQVENYLMTLEKVSDRIKIIDREDDKILMLQYKKDDYDYPSGEPNANFKKDISENGIDLESIGYFVFNYDGVNFQIVPNIPGLEDESRHKP